MTDKFQRVLLSVIVFCVGCQEKPQTLDPPRLIDSLSGTIIETTVSLPAQPRKPLSETIEVGDSVIVDVSIGGRFHGQVKAIWAGAYWVRAFGSDHPSRSGWISAYAVHPYRGEWEHVTKKLERENSVVTPPKP